MSLVSSDSEDYTTKHTVHRPVPILSIDGGGIRGIIPCKVLKAVTERTNKQATELFQLMVGTSTGAIISLGLNVPGEEGKPKYGVDTLLDIFTTKGREVFPTGTCKWLWSLWNPDYDAKGLTKCVDDYFQNTLMTDSINDVVVTSYDAYHNESVCFDNYDNKGEPDLTMAKALLRSTAAPTYFPSQPGKDNANYLDGGIATNNPTQIAYAIAQKLYGKPDDFLFCSLGTGKSTSAISYHNSSHWGELQWADKKRIINVMFNAEASVIDKFMKTLYSSEDESRQYYRFQTPIAANHDALDDSSPENIKYLLETGDTLVEESEEEIREMVKKLEKANIKEKYVVSDL